MKLGKIDVDSRKHIMCKILDLGFKFKVTVNIFPESFPAHTKFLVGHNFAVSDQIAIKLLIVVCYIK